MAIGEAQLEVIGKGDTVRQVLIPTAIAGPSSLQNERQLPGIDPCANRVCGAKPCCGLKVPQDHKCITRGAKLLASAERLKLKEIVSKRRAAPYREGECNDWRKVKIAAWRQANRERWRLFERS